MNVYVCEALTANLGLGAISSLVYSYYYYYYICKALRANPRLGAILSLRYYYYYYFQMAFNFLKIAAAFAILILTSLVMFPSFEI